MKLNKRDLIRFDGTEKLNQAQTMAALHNYAMMKMGVPRQPESPISFYYYTTEKQQQGFFNGMKSFFEAMGIKPEECQKYSVQNTLNDKLLTPITFYFDEKGEVAAMITSKYNENYGKNATKEAIEAYIKEENLSK